MARTERYGHDADGRTPAQRVSAQGYAHCLVAENIAWQFRCGGFTTEALAQSFVRGWQTSPGHRRNMLDPDVTATGVAVEKSARSGWYAVQLFARPQSDTLVFRLSNRSRTTFAYDVDGERFTLPPRTTMTHSQCRPPRVALSLPGGARTLEPRGGERYVVEPAGAGRLRVSQG
jgi:hypothetical protein